MAVALGVLLGVVIFALSGKDAVAPAARSTASAPAVVDPPPAPATAPPPAPATSTSAPEPSSTAAESSSSQASAGRKGPTCKPAGTKCFGNDECCDRTCRKWTCRANAALQDPYGAEKKPALAPKDL